MAYSLGKPEPFETTPYTYLKIVKGDDNFYQSNLRRELSLIRLVLDNDDERNLFPQFFVLCRIGRRSSWFMETWVELEELPVSNGLLWKLGPDTTRPHCMLGTSPTTFKLMEDL